MKSTIKRFGSAAMCVVIAASFTSCRTVTGGTQPENQQSGAQSSEDSSSGEKGEDVILNFVIHGDADSLSKIIKEYNEADNGYRVEIKQYDEARIDENGSSDEADRYRDMAVVHDIIYTTDVDIVCNTSFSNSSSYALLQSKGAFADLYQFMENDPEINTETLDSHILKLNEIDGKLYSIPDFYGIHTLRGESKYVGTKENWNFDDFVKCWEVMPEGSAIGGGFQKESVYWVVLRSNITSFIDYQNAEVHFDSPNFRRMLEFCNSFELKKGDKNDMNYDAPQMVSEVWATRIMQAYVFNRDNGYTCVGYPSEDGNGAYLSSECLSYSICVNSSPEKQQAAWDFLRNIWTVENQIERDIPFITDNGSSYYSTEMGLCVNKEAFDTIAERLINEEYYPKTKESKGETYETRFPTEKDVAELRRYIKTVDRWGTFADRAVWLITNEEILAYFAGEITVDQCIDRIQNRASIWISEQS